ncbi:hypothetical protein GDO86_012168 [Hymenochirus boettgeri]|uniref:UPAR/Ly6 domain-containing protein n=1 Tax=Hymenochirus boettgeri TaxID=247094 RepID=A0A8T2IQ57_9PIPI|nr:hypothetical protein GDO86_012168 [Hymenochirus boettgeri]
MESLLTISLFLSSISTGYALSCVHCRVEEENFCTGQEKRCPTWGDFVCASTSTLTIMEGFTRKTFSRSCEMRSSCGIAGSIGYQKGKIKTSTTCCHADNCIPSTPVLPTENMQRVGLTCRSCTALDSKWCYTDETMECTGEEKRCILQSTTLSGSKSGTTTVRGCATKNLCDIGSQTHNFGDVQMRTDITCTSGAISLHHFVLLFFPVLLVVKLI